MLAVVVLSLGGAARAAVPPDTVVDTWYRLMLELVRHTPTYTPPVASRSFAYVGVTAYEAVASGRDDMVSLAGQLNGLTPLPKREVGAVYDEGVVLQAAMNATVTDFFSNTGPTGQRAMKAVGTKLDAKAADGVDPEVLARSQKFGQAIAAHILNWSKDDGGAVVENMGFPYSYTPKEGPQYWVPTSKIVQQQAPLLPEWGNNRTFAMPSGASCPLPPPPEYSEDPSSQFYIEAKEVYDAVKNTTPEQTAIARFWSDDPMLSSTPPGHWIAIAIQVFHQNPTPIEQQVNVLARLGIGVADAFIGCWDAKYQYDLVRPVTYIKRTIDPKWEPLLITPPFPEYPSGHSTQSGAAAEVLTAIFGDNFAFDDAAQADDGLPARRFNSFWEAAQDAGISRLYGGIHFRSAIEQGLEQGRCVAQYTNALKTLVK
ncbi:MAG: phosphoesterase PA-phosphatase [Cereibacter sphaeroides]|uniref:Phosphoesterase PA-phosphatase n=1 Tax=Cereibacter sphaeroides TaxID=1063 RepID=A0A2W5UCF8_CERSP|nr:MAG: phosphoesterase PA-phosphatase [Cereibacter sphaeroides]